MHRTNFCRAGSQRKRQKEQMCKPRAASWTGLVLGDAFTGSEPRVPLHLHAPEFPTGNHHISMLRNYFLQLYLFFLSSIFHLTETVSIRYSYLCTFCGGASAKQSTETPSFVPRFPRREPRASAHQHPCTLHWGLEVRLPACPRVFA